MCKRAVAELLGPIWLRSFYILAVKRLTVTTNLRVQLAMAGKCSYLLTWHPHCWRHVTRPFLTEKYPADRRNISNVVGLLPPEGNGEKFKKRGIDEEEGREVGKETEKRAHQSLQKSRSACEAVMKSSDSSR